MAQLNSHQLAQEFFGVFLAYSRIIESSLIFGKCPLTWETKKARFVLDLRFWPYYKFWCQVLFIAVTVCAPISLVLLRYLINWLTFPAKLFEENVPFPRQQSMLKICSDRMTDVTGTVMPILFLSRQIPVLASIHRYGLNRYLAGTKTVSVNCSSYIGTNQSRFLASTACPKEENGSRITTSINKIFSGILKFYKILAIGFIGITVIYQFDPLYYIFKQTLISPRHPLVILMSFGYMVVPPLKVKSVKRFDAMAQFTPVTPL
ncbi:hypothetical protein Fcan01_24158 [Folsomia candida]|uniref:Uncharacterized protein n=1 Tax=Folsomia candida TaxID=158441 RepID=A0A226D853_FOLCA|nr:hypothetical protein Fcan01_24158 [Folsomia candida]